MNSTKLILPFLFAFLFISANSMSSQGLPAEDYVYDFVDEMPHFPGGKKTMEKYIQDNLIYPARIKKSGIGGKVYVECIIEKNGDVTNAIAYKNSSKKLEREALRVVLNMPNWIPGKNKGKLVRVKQIIGVNFE